MRRNFSSRRSRRTGMALVVVLVLTMIVALGAYRMLFYMESQYRLTRIHHEQVHARLAAVSGLEFAAALLDQSLDQRAALGGLTNNRRLQHQPIEANAIAPDALTNGDDGWRFSLLAPSDDARQLDLPSSARLSESRSIGGSRPAIRFGLENESAKLHIPTLLRWDKQQPGHARAALLSLPGMSPTLADAWLATLGVTPANSLDGGLRQRLAENSQPTISPAAIEELRFKWYGGDLNQDFRTDDMEFRLEQLLAPSTASSGRGDPARTENAALQALRRYLTWHSGERNETPSGQPRVFLNEPELTKLHQQLLAIWPADWANFVIALRQYGPANSGTNTTAETTANWIPDFSQPAAYSLTSLFDLASAQVSLPGATPSAAKRRLANPFSEEIGSTSNYLERVLNEATLVPGQSIEGRVDVTQAPLEVLLGVPGIDATLAQQIVQQRNNDRHGAPSNLAWLVTSGTINASKLREIEPYVTCRSDVYTVQSIGYRDDQSPTYRTSAIIDARQRPAKILQRQSWHAWGRGFKTEELTSTTP